MNTVLRGMRYMATEVAHGVLDVVEHAVNIWAPLPAQVDQAHSLNLREELEECIEPWGAMESDGPDISKASPAASAGHVGVGGEAVSGPPIPPASPHLNLTQWLEPAVCEVLAGHSPSRDASGELWCYSETGGDLLAHGPYADWFEWREHLAPEVSEHVVVSLSALWGIRL